MARPRENGDAASGVPAEAPTTSGGGSSGPGTGSGAGTGASTTAGNQGNPKDDDDLLEQFRRLQLAMESKARHIKEQEERLAKERETLAQQAGALTSAIARTSDIIALNVGGTHVSTSRRTLTLVGGSLLATMFGGSWDDRLARDDAGRVFLDFDPQLFMLLLNWLRTQDLGGPDTPLEEVGVAAGQEEALLVLVGFLQLQRHVPLRFRETFSRQLSSPHVTVSDASAWRGAGGGVGDYAIAAAAHSCYDMHVEVLVEVLRFGAVPRADAAAAAPGELLTNHPMFVGVVARQQLEAVDQGRKRANVCWQGSCHGWWTARRHAGRVLAGVSKQVANKVLWAEGDSLLLSLDCRKHLPAAQLSLTNTRTGAVQSLTIDAACLAGVEEQWLLVVGLAGRADEVRINTARRRGMKPHQAAA